MSLGCPVGQIKFKIPVDDFRKIVPQAITDDLTDRAEGVPVPLVKQNAHPGQGGYWFIHPKRGDKQICLITWPTRRTVNENTKPH
jgi:hypothetical protein